MIRFTIVILIRNNESGSEKNEKRPKRVKKQKRVVIDERVDYKNVNLYSRL